MAKVREYESGKGKRFVLNFKQRSKYHNVTIDKKQIKFRSEVPVCQLIESRLSYVESHCSDQKEIRFEAMRLAKLKTMANGFIANLNRFVDETVAGQYNKHRARFVIDTYIKPYFNNFTTESLDSDALIEYRRVLIEVLNISADLRAEISRYLQNFFEAYYLQYRFYSI
ncbi:hypothetical protein [Vibrio alfacsensis]|uniref:hypothetical protein n=2 Tax=Vibrio TaxID=662 RepID=UPI00078B51D3|nr:hypothetical protein [Vibrio alfacsensis]BAU70970.1 hypothetical protein [Vibrio sp. 04Ya108]BBM67772.1 hypothetical protein VA249_44180 [Vibrio alfacsensis]BCN26943.1 hypothetical protein VYA_41350 [Vibrio alfacsensis]